MFHISYHILSVQKLEEKLIVAHNKFWCYRIAVFSHEDFDAGIEKITRSITKWMTISEINMYLLSYFQNTFSSLIVMQPAYAFLTYVQYVWQTSYCSSKNNQN